MAEPISAITVEHEADRRIYPDLPAYAATDANFRTHVRAVIASFEAGSAWDLATVEAELLDIIDGDG